MVQNAMLYVWGVIFNGTNWILSAIPLLIIMATQADVDVECRSSQWFLCYIWLIYLDHPQKIRCYYSYVH